MSGFLLLSSKVGKQCIHPNYFLYFCLMNKITIDCFTINLEHTHNDFRRANVYIGYTVLDRKNAVLFDGNKRFLYESVFDFL